MTDPLPASDVHQLPPPKARPPHVFGDPVSIAPDPFRARYQQTERVCGGCHLVKVTVHAADGRAWREWRLPGCADQFSDDRGPPCVPLLAAAS